MENNTQDLTTSNRFSVLARENASDFQPPSLTIDLKEQSCTEKRQHHYVKTRQHQTMIKSLINRIKICQKGMAIATEKSVVKRR